MQRQRVFIQAHRIFGGEELQNSMAAIQKAATSKIDSIETDVFLTRDSEVVILHGEDELGKCSLRPIDQPDAEYRDFIVGDLDYSELQRLTSRELEGGRIPRLEDLLAGFKASGKVLNIEMKDLDPRIVAAVIDRFAAHQMLDRLFLSSFHHYLRKTALDHCRTRQLPVVPFGFLTYSVFQAASEDFLALAQPGDAVTLSYAALRRFEHACPELRSATAKRGVHLNVWFDGTKSGPIETIENFRHLSDLGIHTIITNCPTQAVANAGLL